MLRIERRLESLEVLYKISNIINRTLEREKVLKAVLREVVRITHATSGSIAMLDHKRGVLDIETAINIPEDRWKKLKLQVGIGITGWVAFTKKPARVNDVRRDSHYVPLKPDVRAELAVPMLLNGEVIGVINVDSHQLNAFTQDDEDLLIAAAEQSTRVIETARLYDRQKKHAEQMETLIGLAQELVRPIALNQLFDLIAREGQRLLDADACALVELTEDRTELVIRAQSTSAVPPIVVSDLRLRDTAIIPTIRRHRPVVIEDTSRIRVTLDSRLAGIDEVGALMAVPMIYEEGSDAALAVFYSTEQTLTRTQVGLLQLLANQAAVAIENARRRDRIQAMEENLHQVEKFSLLGTLAAEIAHEIRNPVTIINLLLESIAEETKSNPQVSNDLGIVRTKLDRIERIVDQTLGISRNREPALEPMSINVVVADVLLFMNYKFSKAGVEVRPAMEETLPPVPLDRGQMQQVLLNLMMNAVEAMPEGGRVSVTTKTMTDSRLGPSVAVLVQDNGIGIPAENQPALFEPFFTTRPNGTGLGLFISNRLVVAHGGELRVKSKPGKGSTFTLLLPLRGAEAGA